MIRFYKNGTAGAQDGTVLSNGDLTNPLVADGFYPAAGVTVTKDITVCVRADSGETWKGVILALMSSSSEEHSKFSITADHNISMTNFSSIIYFSESFPFFPELTDVNQAFTLTIKASGDETNSPDTSQKLMVIGGRQIA